MLLTSPSTMTSRRRGASSLSSLLQATTLLCLLSISFALNGELVELECPVDCHCHYFRVNWVTDCSESNLTTIPLEGLSPSVYVLDMNGNNVEQIEPFPEDTKLRTLQIAHNKLTELKYESFAGLNHLLEADFSYNAIAHLDPEAFRDSPGLIQLELQHNPLPEIKGPILVCPALRYLYLSTCGIRSLNPQFFQNITTLTTLDLSNNPLVRIEPGSFDSLTSLENLKLSSCNLTSISPGAFAKLENLRELELDDNDLSSIDWTAVLSPLIRLELLNIRKTHIFNLPGDAFARNPHLLTLVLADNELQHLNVSSTLGHNLHTLHSLDLSNCNLQDRLSEEAFRNASALRVLNLSGNPMFASDLTAVLRHLPELHKLSLSNCSLRKLPEAFEDLVELRELDVSHNPLSDAFVRLFKPLKSLEYLDMSYCNLGHVGNNTFTLMTSLKHLIMSGNTLHTLEQGLFANLTRLETLELKDCGFKHPLEPKVFGDRVYANIIELKLAKNPLSVPKEGPLLPKQLSGLERLDLSNCDISSMNENLFNRTKNLTQLNLSNNKISGMDSLVSLKKLRNLEHLDLSSNNLTTINPKVFKANSRLISLNLMSNPFVCNCSIVEMWNWALKEKDDLDVLVGSQPSHYSAGSVKLRKSLSCSYDPETYRGILEQSRTTGAPQQRPSLMRKGDMTPNRTWAKYIRESQCGKRP